MKAMTKIKNSDKREDQCSDDVAERNKVHLICLLV